MLYVSICLGGGGFEQYGLSVESESAPKLLPNSGFERLDELLEGEGERPPACDRGLFGGVFVDGDGLRKMDGGFALFDDVELPSLGLMLRIDAAAAWNRTVGVPDGALFVVEAGGITDGAVIGLVVVGATKGVLADDVKM
jgi:hypothetical protein